MSNNVYAEFTY